MADSCRVIRTDETRVYCFREKIIQKWDGRRSRKPDKTRKIADQSNGTDFPLKDGKNLKRMFTLEEFRVMTFEKKCDVITFYGNYLLQRTLADCKVFLYFAEGFFIEVFYSPKHQKVLMINAFDRPIGLEPYLDKISLEDLTVGPAI